MFANHQPTISAYARESADNFARVAQFVILTIQNSLEQVPADWDTVDAGGDDAMGVLYGWKFAAWHNVWEKREYLFTACEHAWTHAESERELAAAVVDLFAHEPGFGLAKAGFVAQLIYGVAGCLDTHNIVRFGLPAERFAKYKTFRTAKTRRKRLNEYLDTCEALGGCEALWDGWCAYVADKRPKVYADAIAVSLMHLKALGLA
jgi:hypothetical protein